MTILVDYGRTHNFIYINLAKQFIFFVHPMRDIKVKIVDGQEVKGLGWCHKVYV